MALASVFAEPAEETSPWAGPDAFAEKVTLADLADLRVGGERIWVPPVDWDPADATWTLDHPDTSLLLADMDGDGRSEGILAIYRGAAGLNGVLVLSRGDDDWRPRAWWPSPDSSYEPVRVEAMDAMAEGRSLLAATYVSGHGTGVYSRETSFLALDGSALEGLLTLPTGGGEYPPPGMTRIAQAWDVTVAAAADGAFPRDIKARLSWSYLLQPRPDEDSEEPGEAAVVTREFRFAWDGARFADPSGQFWATFGALRDAWSEGEAARALARLGEPVPRALGGTGE